MTLPVTHFVDVTVNVGGAAVDRFSFGTPMGVFEHTVSDNRQDGPYTSVTEMVADGFASTDEAHKWATAVFSQDPAPADVIIGRKVAAGGDPASQVWQVDASGAPDYVDMTAEAGNATDADVVPFPAMEEVGDLFYIGWNEIFGLVTFDYANGTAGVGGVVVWEYWDGTAWSLIGGVTDNTNSFTTAVADGLTVTFTAPNDWARTVVNNSASLYFIRARITTIYTTNPILDQIHIAGDADYTEALDAIELDDPDSWYATNIESRTDQDILDTAAWIESRTKIFIAQSSDPDLPAGVASNIGEQLQTLNYNQTALIYHADDTEYLDGAWTGRGSAYNLDVPDGTGPWGQRQLTGITVDSLNSAQANAIWGYDANLYGSLKGLSFTADGTMASSRFIDITTTNHWFETRINEEILALQVGSTNGIPYDQSGLNRVGAAIQAVCDRGVLYGHFNGDDSPPQVKIPKFTTISAADKQARTATYTVNVTYKNFIQSVTITVNASF